MPHSKDSYTPPGSDEALHRMMNPSLWNCQGSNLETTMLSEALASTTQHRKEKKSNSGKIIRLEIAVSLILIGVALLLGVDQRSKITPSSYGGVISDSQPNTVKTSVDIKAIETTESTKSINNFSEDAHQLKLKVSFD